MSDDVPAKSVVVVVVDSDFLHSVTDEHAHQTNRQIQHTLTYTHTPSKWWPLWQTMRLCALTMIGGTGERSHWRSARLSNRYRFNVVSRVRLLMASGNCAVAVCVWFILAKRMRDARRYCYISVSARCFFFDTVSLSSHHRQTRYHFSWNSIFDYFFQVFWRQWRYNDFFRYNIS